MTTGGPLSEPDPHLRPDVARRYDETVGARLDPKDTEAMVALLAELAGEGVAVEFAVGTGRIALPLAARGIPVHGLDFSEPMLAELRAKPGASELSIHVGDMSKVRVCSDATLVYLVFNTITNLRSQDQQVACFQNAATHLAPGGRFLIETYVPKLRRLSPDSRIIPFDLSPTHLGFDEYIDFVNQISVSHHYDIEDGDARVQASAFRYVWPSELDLMARIAGLELESRWADARRTPFTDDAPAHVSVWRKR